jgi:hypothetical protein
MRGVLERCRQQRGSLGTCRISCRWREGSRSRSIYNSKRGCSAQAPDRRRGGRDALEDDVEKLFGLDEALVLDDVRMLLPIETFHISAVHLVYRV